MARGVVERLYDGLLRLCPGSFRDAYADEMRVVFRLRLTDARSLGRLGFARVWAHELVDLSLLAAYMHIRDNLCHKQPPKEAIMLALEPAQDVRIARWLARGLGLAMALFFLHVLSRLLPDNGHLLPLLIAFLLATTAMLAAWRWERRGGLATILCALLIGFAGLYGTYIYEASRGVIIWWALVVSWLLWTWPFLMVGWLFVKISRVVAARASAVS